MKKIALVFLLLLVSSIAEAQWTRGLNLRNTSGYCTDAANTTYYLSQTGGGGDVYPVTRGSPSLTFGDVATLSIASRNDVDNGIDCRLAGNSYSDHSAAKQQLRIDLPNAGTYDINIAMGNALFGGTNPQAEIFDNTTLLWTVAYTGTLPGFPSPDFLDANNVVRTSPSDWVTNNTPKRLTFSTTTLIIKYGRANSDGGSSGLTHVFVTEVTPTPTPTPSVTTRKGQDCLQIKGQCFQ